MWDFLDSKSHRHLVIPHKKATLTWTNILNVTYNQTHNLTSAGFRIPVSLEPGETYQLSAEVQILKGDPAFIYVETKNAKRLLPRYKIHQNNNTNQPSKYEWVFSTDDQSFDQTFIGILFFYPDQDYEMNVHTLKLQKLQEHKLTTQNLAQHNQNQDELSIVPSSLPSIKPDFEKLLINTDASHLTVTPSEYQQLILGDLVSTSTSTSASIQHQKRNIRHQKRNIQHQKENNQNTKSQGSVGQPKRFSVAPSKHKMSRFSALKKVPKKPPSLPDGGQMDQIPEPSADILTYLAHISPRIVVGLTTTPKRIGKIYSVVESLLNQSLAIDRVYLVVPERYKKTNKPYLIGKKWATLLASKRFRIIRCPDYGPMTKLLGLLKYERNPQTLMLTADDDHFYPFHWAYYLAFLPLMQPKFPGIFGLKGYWEQHVMTCAQEDDTQIKARNMDFLCGEWGVAGYFAKWLKRNTEGLIRQLGYCPEAYISDDVLIGNHAAKSGVARILVGSSEALPKPMKWANQIDALNRMKPSQGARYLTVMSALREKNNYHLHNLGQKFAHHGYFDHNPRLSFIPPDLENPNNNRSVSLIKKNKNMSQHKKKKLSKKNANFRYYTQYLPNDFENNIKTNSINNNNTKDQIKNNTKDQNEIKNNTKDQNEIRKNTKDQNEIKNNAKINKSYVKTFGELKSQNIFYLPKPNVSLYDHEFNPESLSNKKILYLSFMPPENPDLALMYLKQLQSADVTLRFPQHQEVKIYQDIYQPWLNQRYRRKYDLIILDIPYCFKDVEIKDFPGVPHFYIYRYPELGNILTMLKKFPILVNSNYYGYDQAKRWSVVPDLEYDAQKIPNWRRGATSTKMKHYCWILSHDYYLNNLEDFLVNYWKKYNPPHIKLHLGLVGPPALALQKKLNDLGLNHNITLYTQSHIFPTLIYHADFYLNVGFYLDFYALWAHQTLQKPLVMLKYGEFEQVPLLREIPYDLSGKRVICKHDDCSAHRCRYYGYAGVENIPQVDWEQFHILLTQNTFS